MKRRTKFRYDVSEGETVTIKVTPIETGARVTAADNGEALENPATGPIRPPSSSK